MSHLKITKYLLFTIFVSIFFVSCLSTRSAFSNKRLTEGITKERVIKEFGQPFREDLPSTKNGQLIEVLYYKEHVYSSGTITDKGSFIVTTKLTFEASKLVKKEQTDELVYDMMPPSPAKN